MHWTSRKTYHPENGSERVYMDRYEKGDRRHLQFTLTFSSFGLWRASPTKARTHNACLIAEENHTLRFLLYAKIKHKRKYVLIFKYDISSYTWLYAAESSNAETVVDALTGWFSALALTKTWISSWRSQFKNAVIKQLSKKLHCVNHFYLAWLPVGKLDSRSRT